MLFDNFTERNSYEKDEVIMIDQDIDDTDSETEASDTFMLASQQPSLQKKLMPSIQNPELLTNGLLSDLYDVVL